MRRKRDKYVKIVMFFLAFCTWLNVLNLSYEYAAIERKRKKKKKKDANTKRVRPNPVIVYWPGKGCGEFLPFWLYMKIMGLVELNLSK